MTATLISQPTPDLPTGCGPAIAPVLCGPRWTVADPDRADGGNVFIAIVKDEIDGPDGDRRHAHVLVPLVLCAEKMGHRRETYVRNLLRRCRIYRRWQLESLFPSEV